MSFYMSNQIEHRKRDRLLVERSLFMANIGWRDKGAHLHTLLWAPKRQLNVKFLWALVQIGLAGRIIFLSVGVCWVILRKGLMIEWSFTKGLCLYDQTSDLKQHKSSIDIIINWCICYSEWYDINFILNKNKLSSQHYKNINASSMIE